LERKCTSNIHLFIYFKKIDYGLARRLRPVTCGLWAGRQAGQVSGAQPQTDIHTIFYPDPSGLHFIVGDLLLVAFSQLA
jgi:hypothetical protein